jgi:hypothetical protein
MSLYYIFLKNQEHRKERKSAMMIINYNLLGPVWYESQQWQNPLVLSGYYGNRMPHRGCLSRFLMFGDYFLINKIISI